MMEVEQTAIIGALILQPRLFGDSRGFFLESWNARTFAEVTAVTLPFVQDNHSRSSRGVLRGLHYQLQQPQGKLVRVTQGKVFDVAVDLRRNSESFGRWVGVELDGERQNQFWIPPGCAHGFLVLSEQADFLYKTTDYYAPEHERTLRWDDPTLAIEWPQLARQEPQLSDKDRMGLSLQQCEVYP